MAFAEFGGNLHLRRTVLQSVRAGTPNPTLVVGAEAAIEVIWLITIASALSGDWPPPGRWVMLLGTTGMLVSRRIRRTHPKLSEPVFLAAAIVVIVAMYGLRR